jgi:hypothetical protein
MDTSSLTGSRWRSEDGPFKVAVHCVPAWTLGHPPVLVQVPRALLDSGVPQETVYKLPEDFR